MRDDLEGAEREMREALRVHRGCPSAANGLFHVLSRTKRWVDLRNVLEQAHAARPGESWTRILLAYRRAEDNDIDEARDLLRDIDTLPEENEVTDLALLSAALSTRELEIAGRELTRLGPMAATNATVAEVLGSMWMEFRPAAGDPVVMRPRAYTPTELNAELERRLSVEERKLVVNPLEITAEIAAEGRRLTIGLTNDVQRAIAIYAEVARRGRGAGDAGTRTAGQALEDSKDSAVRFSCQEHAKLFVALARSVGMETWLVHIDRDADGYPCYHDCAALLLNGHGMLVDLALRSFGIRHEEFIVLDDLQAISHQAMQHHRVPDSARLRMGMKLNPDDTWTRLQFVRGMALVDESAAAEELSRVRNAGGERWDIYDAAAVLEMARERWRPALAELQHALRLSPSNALVHVRIAHVYDQLEDRARATEHLEAALRYNRGELSRDRHRDMPSQIATMKTFVLGAGGDASAQAELERRAAAGDAFAQMGMAKASFDAKPQRVEEGMRWLLMAAQQGNAQAQCDYARNLTLLSNGRASEVMQWFSRAAEQGHAEAQYRLGLLLYEGKLVPRDNTAAGQWILLAAGGGNSDARHLMREMELFISADELAEARKRATAFKPVESRPVSSEEGK
jgi:TPR repeat protein